MVEGEFTHNSGLDFLVCSDTEDGQDQVYIGEAENPKKRLLQHINDYKTGKEKYLWQNAIVFSSSELNKALIRYLEHNLTTKAQSVKRCTVLTKSTYGETKLKRYEEDSMRDFMEKIEIELASLNYRFLEENTVSSVFKEENQTNDSSLFYLSNNKASGCGYITTDGKFVLLKGAKINTDSCSQSFPPMLIKRRESGSIVNNETQEDLVFSSSSYAAAFLLGYRVSGPQSWKNKEGKSILELNRNK